MSRLVTKTASAPSDATESLRLLDGDAVSISLVGTGFTGTVKLQRNFNAPGAPEDWRTVQSYTTDAENDYVARTAQDVRLIATAASAGTMQMELRKSPTRGPR